MIKTRTARVPVRNEAEEAAPAREPVRAKVRTRKGVGTDKLYVPPELIPQGMDFQWNVDTLIGQPQVQERMAMEQQAWEPVDPSKEPFTHLDGVFMRRGHVGEINVGGLVLMWRPIELTLEARGEELQAARRARHVEERKLAQGTPDGVNLDMLNPNHGSAPARTFIRKERIPSMPVQE